MIKQEGWIITKALSCASDGRDNYHFGQFLPNFPTPGWKKGRGRDRGPL